MRVGRHRQRTRSQADGRISVTVGGATGCWASLRVFIDKVRFSRTDEIVTSRSRVGMTEAAAAVRIDAILMGPKSSACGYGADEFVAHWLHSIYRMTTDIEAIAAEVRSYDLSARYLVVTDDAASVLTVPTRSHLYRLLEASGSHLVIDELSPNVASCSACPHSRLIPMKNSGFDGLF